LDGVEFTRVIADAALDTFVLVQFMRLFLFTADSFLRTFTSTDATPGTGFSVNFIMKQGFADTGRAFFIFYVGFIFIPEVKNGG
jgi:hypothetical protein